MFHLESLDTPIILKELQRLDNSIQCLECNIELQLTKQEFELDDLKVGISLYVFLVMKINVKYRFFSPTRRGIEKFYFVFILIT